MNLIIITTIVEEGCSRSSSTIVVVTRLLLGSNGTTATLPTGDLGELLLTGLEDFVEVLACHFFDELVQTLFGIAVKLDVHGRKNILAVRSGGGGVSADNRQHVSTDDLHVFKHKAACCLSDLIVPM